MAGKGCEKVARTASWLCPRAEPKTYSQTGTRNARPTAETVIDQAVRQFVGRGRWRAAQAHRGVHRRDLEAARQQHPHLAALLHAPGRVAGLRAEAEKVVGAGHTPDGAAITNITLATTDTWKDKATGEKQIVEGVVDRDDCNRADTTLESLAALKPVFADDGSVTAGNASQLSDGASMTLVMTLEKAIELGLKPKAFFRGFTVAGCEPDEMGIGPVFSVPKLLKARGLSVADIDLWELNEAFASQCLYARDRLEIDNAKYNVNGGSISIGHPFGMTGSRQVGHLVRELQRRNLRYGIVTMCVGGGMGATGLFEAVR